MKKWLLAAGLLVSISVHADFLDWNKLRINGQSDHEANRTNYGSGYFEGYIMGAVDMVNGIAICMPPTVTAGQVIAIVIKYANENPETWNKPADLIISKALIPIYPCHRPAAPKRKPTTSRTF